MEVRTSERRTCPVHRHSVVGLQVISSGIFTRISSADPMAGGASVAKKVPRSERFSDSAVRSVEPDFQMRTRRDVLTWRRRDMVRLEPTKTPPGKFGVGVGVQFDCCEILRSKSEG